MSVFHNNILAGASGSGGDPVYVDDVFSCFLYDGSYPSTQSIDNGIDVSGEGGLVWIKRRDSSGNHWLVDTERGASKYLETNTTDAEGTDANGVTSFNSDGFSLGTGGSGHTNSGSGTYVSWTFRKAPGFFDVVQFTTSDTATDTVSHSLGSTPGFIVVKRASNTSGWFCWNRTFSNANNYIRLDKNNGLYNLGQAAFSNVGANSFDFNSAALVGDGHTCIAYIFAHDDQSFGTDSDEAIINCGSFTTNSSSEATVNLGFEPQYFMFKRTDGADDWYILDTMRGFGAYNNDQFLEANTSEADNLSRWGEPTATGWTNVGSTMNFGSSQTYIYMAIRRPHKPPEAASDVFGVVAGSNEPSNTSGGGELTSASGVLADLILHRPRRSSSGDFKVCDRLRGDDIHLETNTTGAEADASGTFGGFWKFDRNENAYIPGPGLFNNTTSNTPYVVYSFTRAPEFFDAVAYTGNGANNHQQGHNLTVQPELAIFKERNDTDSWVVFFNMNASTYSYAFLDSNGSAGTQSYGSGFRMAAQPSATTLFLANYNSTNQSSKKYIAYLFASLSGVSKIGTYTGTGSAGNNIDCGFTNGARFVIVKRTDSSGEWFVADTARGINANSDPFLNLNNTNSENNSVDWIDAYSAGFTINGTGGDFNASGGTYLFLAIA